METPQTNNKFGEALTKLIADLGILTYRELDEVLCLEPGRIESFCTGTCFPRAEVITMIIDSLGIDPHVKNSEAMKEFMRLMDEPFGNLHKDANGAKFPTLAHYLFEPRVKTFLENLALLPVEAQKRVIDVASMYFLHEEFIKLPSILQD